MLAESEKVRPRRNCTRIQRRLYKDWGLRARLKASKELLTKKKTFIAETEKRILNMQSLYQQDSKLNKRLDLILKTRKLILEYASQRRNSLAKPLQDGFSEGFKLLSRKAKSVKEVQISALSDYSPSIKQWRDMMVTG